MLHVVVASERSGPEKFDWAAIGALGALVASITYLFLNSAYVEFYGKYLASALRTLVSIA